MADIRKTFNFRAGVQVDDDVFIVRGEQVGIGTTIPTEALDVRGNLKVVGILTSQHTDFSAGISTFGDVKIGTGISISASSGIITATTFSGDGSLLQNVPTSSWVQYNQLDDNGLSVVSIAKSTGNVGIATTGASSTNDLQIGSDPQDGISNGVGIGSDGNIYASGIITATTFSGSATSLTSIPAGQLTGTVADDRIATLTASKLTGALPAISGQSLTNLTGAASSTYGNSTTTPVITVDVNGRITNIISTGITGTVATSAATIDVTATSSSANHFVTFVDQAGTARSLRGDSGIIYNPSSNNLAIDGNFTATNVTATGVLDVDGHTELDNVNISGVVTATTYKGDGSNLTGITPSVGITTNLSGSFTATAGSPTIINTHTYGSELLFEYTVFVKNGSDYQSQKLLVMRDGTTVTSTQYAIMYSNNLLVQLDATITAGNVINLRATPETGISGSTTYRLRREVT